MIKVQPWHLAAAKSHLLLLLVFLSKGDALPLEDKGAEECADEDADDDVPIVVHGQQHDDVCKGKLGDVQQRTNHLLEHTGAEQQRLHAGEGRCAGDLAGGWAGRVFDAAEDVLGDVLGHGDVPRALPLAEDEGVVLLGRTAQELEQQDEQDDADAGAGEHGVRLDVPGAGDEASIDSVPVPYHRDLASTSHAHAHAVPGGKFAECFNRAQEAVAKWSRAGFLAKLVTFDKKYHADAKYCQEFIDEFVTRGLEMKRTGELAKLLESKRYVFLHHLVNRLDDPVRIRSELLNILLAGRDTTASLLSNVWWTLAHRPDVFAKLKAEVDTLGAERPTFELIKDMKYLKAVLNESLRVHPLVPQNARQAFEDTTLPLGGGPDGSKPLFMPKGSVMIWSVYAMHRRKDIYGDDAEEFKPERWLGDKGLRPGWEYLPFNGGPRICLGQQFALTEASYTTIRLMQAVSKLEPRDGSTEWREWLTLTAAVENCKVGLFA